MPKENSNVTLDDNVNGYVCGNVIIRPYSDSSDLPNFEHVPSGFKMSWYKYPLRAADANRDLTFIEFMNILGWDRRKNYEA